MRTGRRDQPVASRTPLGWVVHGAHPGGKRQRVNFVAHATTADANMDEALRHYFAIEGLTVAAKTPKNDPDERALKILRETTQQQPDGRYETALLWREESLKMPNNFEAALNRLMSIEKKLEKDPNLKERYKQQMNALVAKGYAEVAPSTGTKDRTWYLPHFGVTHPMKPDKIRIVHDAAAKTRGKSLNEFLLTGPDLLQSLPGVMMRFRQHAVAVSADITEMFMQIGVRSEDRDALRHLWREDPSQEPTEYRMKFIIFGATSSPATAIYVKNANAEKYRLQYPDAADAIVRNHYMDDYLGSYRTSEDAIRIANEVREVHRQGHFELRKWTSNNEEVRCHMTDEAPPTSVTLSDGTEIERVLGLVWRPAEDVLAFNLDVARIPKEVLESSAPTKRQALRIMMSVYDPQGIASPVTVGAKKILQETWRRGTAWDSSESAYAAALYWRAEMPDGEIRTSLVLAKARVAPLKLTSIPRLELQAAVMGSRMAAAVTEEHDRKPDARMFWTDSATVLTWLRTGSRSYRPFVAHRIAAIEENSTVEEWRWVPTKENVADDATTEIPVGFEGNHRWFIGPEYLRRHPDDWPVQRTARRAEDTGEEKCAVLAVSRESLGEAVPHPRRFSKWEKYLRATGRILQFVGLCRRSRDRTYYKRTRRNPRSDPTWEKNAKKKTPKTPLITPRTPEHAVIRYRTLDADTLRRAEMLIWRQSQRAAFEESQRAAFEEEILALQRGKQVSPASRLRNLSVTYADGILRINGRIGNIEGANVITSSLVLDGSRRETRLMIDFIHRKMHHAGTEATIAECRQSYWVLRLRPVTRSVIHNCLPCRIRKDTPPRPATGDHPPSRLAHHRRPFTYVGLDYFGPYQVTTGRSTQKHYVAIFTCLTTRAVHLEPAESLSTDSAVIALRRMIARRGAPTEIWSDNGTNLRGADKELRQALDKATEHEASLRLIQWRFIPPGAPFMGGAWEIMVRAVKAALSATEQPRHPTSEIFHTLLAEAEFTMNSRPLTHVSVSADDPDPLTPNHFLLGGPARVPVPGKFDDADLIRRAHWRAAQRIIEEVYPGAEGITRVVDVCTAGGILRRPAKKIIVLPTMSAAHQGGCSDVNDAARREDVRDGRK
uniref:Integrase catalytic domain-containing protein n=1 Tax=Bombyx mori TaxID=7091 RepID=A0A8R2M8R1_BOMMO|nr:uncharacterized protein LOC119630457 [Bombyx mori]